MMKSYVREIRYALALPTLYLLGCGPVTTAEDSERKVKRVEQAPELLNFYADLADTNCVPSAAAAKITTVKTYEQTGVGLKRSAYQLGGGSSVPSLHSDAVSETTYGLHRQTDCVYEDGSVECEDSTKTVRLAKPLVICNPDLDFQRFSPEQVALTTIAGIEQARAAYSEANNSDPNLPLTALTVLPRIEKKVVKPETENSQSRTASLFDTDNLAYAPRWNGGPTFIVYPKGKFYDEKGLWKDKALWESRWVIAHEFGHHVFRYHAEYGLSKSSVHDVPRPLPPGFSETNAPSAPLQLASGDLVSRTISAFNEGFADLYANTVIDPSSRPLAALDCFRSSRDALRSEYEDGTPKILTERVLGIFTGRIRQSGADGCRSPRFTDAHAIGAIVAHSILTNYPAATTAAGQRELRSALVSWAEAVKSIIRSSTNNPEQLISAFLAAFVESAKSHNRAAASPICRDFSSRFSALGDSLGTALQNACK